MAFRPAELRDEDVNRVIEIGRPLRMNVRTAHQGPVILNGPLWLVPVQILHQSTLMLCEYSTMIRSTYEVHEHVPSIDVNECDRILQA